MNVHTLTPPSDLQETLRDPLFQRRVAEIGTAGAQWVRAHPDILPRGLFRDFFLWACGPGLKAEPPFHKAASFQQITMYAAYNSLGIVDETLWPDYVRLCTEGWLQSNLLEFVTDDLNHHYRTNLESDPTRAVHQRAALTGFNAAFGDKLRGSETPTSELLAALPAHLAAMSQDRPLLRNGELWPYIQAFLAATGQRAEDQDFTAVATDLSGANIDYCLASLRAIRGQGGYASVIERIAARYASISTLLDPDIALTQSETLRIRASEIMVSSSLLHFITHLAMVLGAEERLNSAVATGLTARIAEHADMLTRISNDLGPLVAADPEDVAAIFDGIAAAHTPGQSLAEAVARWRQSAAVSHAAMAKRWAGDMVLGEENITRSYGAGRKGWDVPAHLAYMRAAIGHYREVYATTAAAFQTDRERLSAHMGATTYSDLAGRFVTSMQKLYQAKTAYFDEKPEAALAGDTEDTAP